RGEGDGGVGGGCGRGRGRDRARTHPRRRQRQPGEGVFESALRRFRFAASAAGDPHRAALVRTAGIACDRARRRWALPAPPERGERAAAALVRGASAPQPAPRRTESARGAGRAMTFWLLAALLTAV